MGNDTAALMVIIELRQRVAELEAEVARLTAEQQPESDSSQNVRLRDTPKPPSP